MLRWSFHVTKILPWQGSSYYQPKLRWNGGMQKNPGKSFKMIHKCLPSSLIPSKWVAFNDPWNGSMGVLVFGWMIGWACRFRVWFDICQEKKQPRPGNQKKNGKKNSGSFWNPRGSCVFSQKIPLLVGEPRAPFWPLFLKVKHPSKKQRLFQSKQVSFGF